MRVFGLTGGIATGKSAVAKLLRERGVPVIDLDEVARDVVANGLSVRETEALVRKEVAPPAPAPAKSADPNTRAAEEQLRLALGTRVRIVRRGRGGRIEVEFSSEDELQRLFEHLTGGR